MKTQIITERLTGLFVYTFFIFMLLASCAIGEEAIPAAETPLKDTVDHWGLAFSDDFRLYQTNFSNYSKANNLRNPEFVLGTETSLRKTFRNKYWFKGNWSNTIELQAGKNESESFQIAILPKIGTTLKGITITASALKTADGKSEISASFIKLWRVGFVKTATPQYPVRHIGEWPDPLLELGKPFTLNGLDLGLIWCEVKVPWNTAPGNYTGTITVKAENAKSQSLTVKLHVWNFALPDRIQRPTMVWIKGDMNSPEYLKVCSLFLEHHIDPISVGNITNLDLLDKNLQFCIDRGLMFFQTPNYNAKKSQEFREYYDHIKAKGWLDKALTYGACDEPTEEKFRNVVLPATKALRKEFPGTKTFLASEYHPDMDDGTDIWMTDLSTNFTSWLKSGRHGKQQMWMYFCHLPIGCKFDQPLVDAPNMLIDNDAIEHRVLNWMAWGYNAKGVLIWAGNNGWPDKYDGNAETAYSLDTKPMSYPYGGIHNGNGFLIYPGPRPSIRLKVLRDGIEDYWYLTQVEKYAQAGNADAQKLLKDVKPTIFVDTHYYARDPQQLVDYRNRLGKFLNNLNESVQ